MPVFWALCKAWGQPVFIFLETVFSGRTEDMSVNTDSVLVRRTEHCHAREQGRGELGQDAGGPGTPGGGDERNGHPSLDRQVGPRSHCCSPWRAVWPLSESQGARITLATAHKAPFDKAPISSSGNTVTTAGTLLRTDLQGKLRALFGQY